MKIIKQETEKEISNAILLKVGGRRDVLAWKNMTGTARALTAPYQVIQYGKKGSSDILGVIGPWGLFFGIEVKTLAGQQRDTQKTFEESVKRRGGIYIIGRYDETALKDLLMARAIFAEKMGLGHLINYENLEIEGYE
ncbi:MAG: hypothetical protein V4721_00340 [Bacteroidota bacterium]